MRRDPSFSIGFAGGGGDDALEILIHVFLVLSFTFWKKKTSSMASLWLGERSEPKFSCFLPGNKVISIFRQEEIYNNTLTNMEWIFTSIFKEIICIPQQCF